MKPQVLQILTTAKVLFNTAQEMCCRDDKHIASAGLIVLQDAIEHILLSCLIEIGMDEHKSIEEMSFDQLISALKSASIRVPRSGTLKALNKQRVIIKHYGQVADASTVAAYYEAAHHAINQILSDVVGKQLEDVLLHDIIRDPEIKSFFVAASIALSKGDYVATLIEIRKAIFMEIEVDYFLYGWAEANGPPMESVGRAVSGLKAARHKQHKAWIEENVSEPFDYVQIDQDKLRQDLLEWGAISQDFWNIIRLTPATIKLQKGGDWLVRSEPKHIRDAANKNIAKYCLDRAIALLIKKQSHSDLSRDLLFNRGHEFSIEVKQDADLLRKASHDALQVARLAAGSRYLAQAIVPGLDGMMTFVRIADIQDEEPRLVFGYLPLEQCKVL